MEPLKENAILFVRGQQDWRGVAGWWGVAAFKSHPDRERQIGNWRSKLAECIVCPAGAAASRVSRPFSKPLGSALDPCAVAA